MEVLHGIFFQYKAASTLKTCCLMYPPSFIILVLLDNLLVPPSALAASPCTFILWRWLLYLNLRSQPLLATNFFPAVSLPLLVFMELKRIKALLWMRLWLKGLLSLVWSLSWPLKHSPYQQWTISHSYCSWVHLSSTFNFLREFFLCNHNLAVWWKRPSFWPILAFDMVPH